MSECKLCCAVLDHVTVYTGNNLILEDITMPIHYGEITGIIGPNGAGKTTLFRTLLDEVPYTGNIQFGKNAQVKKERTTIGYVPQHLQFDKSMPLTVLELFAICLKKKPVWLPIHKSFREQVYRMLEEVHLEYVLDRRIGMLSGGELQRVLLALALMPVPDLLLLDEPISGVDVSGQELFYETVESLKSKHQMAIVLITHEVGKLEHICDKAIFLNKKILGMGDPRVIQSLAYEVMEWK